MLLPAREGRCPRGFSTLQIAILSVLKSLPECIAYWQIAQLIRGHYGLKTTEGAVRGTLERFGNRNILMAKRATRGLLKGNRYAFRAEPCRHIIPLSPRAQSGMESDTESDQHPDDNAQPSILEEKIDRKKNLSVFSQEQEVLKAARSLEKLTEEDIAFHWPGLASTGFGTHQIRQILFRLEQVCIPPDGVLQGLTYAEWELSRGVMRDGEGKNVLDPMAWVFTILARQGYYKRPANYVSPQMQAELDRTVEIKSLQEAREARILEEFEFWRTALTVAERTAIVRPENGPSYHMPEDVALRQYFHAQVRPTLQESVPKESAAG
jgi:hypothetical protein